MGAAETGPIRLHHPWQLHSVGVQAGRSMSPIPRFFELNQGPGYIPLLITNNQGRNVPAKYISVHMTANPYTLGKLKSDGPMKWGEIHAAPRYDLSRPLPWWVLHGQGYVLHQDWTAPCCCFRGLSCFTSCSMPSSLIARICPMSDDTGLY